MRFDLSALLQQETRQQYGRVTLRLQWCKLRWQELVQSQKEYWPFRDDPSKLDWAPAVRQKLLQLEADAEPVVCGAEWVGASYPPQPVTLLEIELGPKDVHHAVLLWTVTDPSTDSSTGPVWDSPAAPTWELVDTTFEPPWREWVVATLSERMPVSVVPASGCHALDYLLQRLHTPPHVHSWTQYQSQERNTPASLMAARVCHQLVHQKLSSQR